MEGLRRKLLWRHGFLRTFLEMFSLFAITDDYAAAPNSYPPSMKAVLPEAGFQTINHTWHFMYFDRTRTVKWRPRSNVCDPDWLAADLLGNIVDTLQVDYARKRKHLAANEEAWGADRGAFQLDYVLESGMRIGPDEDEFLTSEGKSFRWINGSAEHNAIVSFRVDNLSDNEADIAKLNRMLSALVWHQKSPIVKQWGAGGPRRPYPVVYGPRMSGMIQIERRWAQQALDTEQTPEQWLALALFREGVNSRSEFYAYLCFWKVVEHSLKGKQREWINNVARGLSREKEKIDDILNSHGDLAKYLWDARRNAIAHVLRKTMNPDDPKDERIIKRDTYVMQDFARVAIETVLGVKH
jgi:hypothetical protein